MFKFRKLEGVGISFFSLIFNSVGQSIRGQLQCMRVRCLIDKKQFLNGSPSLANIPTSYMDYYCVYRYELSANASCCNLFLILSTNNCVCTATAGLLLDANSNLNDTLV